MNARGGVEDTRLKAKDTKKTRPRPRTDYPRTGIQETNANNHGHNFASGLQAKKMSLFIKITNFKQNFGRLPKKENFCKLSAKFRTFSKKKKVFINFREVSGVLQDVEKNWSCPFSTIQKIVLSEPRTEHF